jgi:phosphate transport system permease protein
MTTEISKNSNSVVDFNSPKIRRYNRIRHLKDRFATGGIAVGGWGVIASILMIFLFLLNQVIPMFQSAKVLPLSAYEIPGTRQEMLYLAVEELNEMGVRFSRNGQFDFFNVNDGKLVSQYNLPLPEGVTVSSFALNSEESRLLVAGLSNGKVIIVSYNYQVTYPDDKRTIVPVLDYPYGEEALVISPEGKALESIALRDKSSALVIVANDGNHLTGMHFAKQEDFLSDAIVLTPQPMELPELDGKIGQLNIDTDQNFVFAVLNNRKIAAINIASQDIAYVKPDADIADVKFLLGGISLMVADTEGNIGQWFLVRNEDGEQELKNVRTFTGDYKGNDLLIASEQRRKGFASVNGDGVVSLYYSAAHRTVFSKKMLDAKPLLLALSPRGNRLLVATADNKIHVLEVENKHPEISWSSLWEKVWYESYPEPQYTWQSSAANNDFEPKMSLMPLTFGTLKAAFYAMLLGAPLAICGAIYTAYFMTPVMRRKIKPLLELMEALPTVILGFLAGLWLAPFMEKNLAAIFSVLIIMPFGIIGFAYIMSRLPLRWQNRINEGWHAFILIPVVLLIGGFCFFISPVIETLLFGGDLRLWLTNEAGITFDQRNALVVGIAMGFAVIPVIFSISEDAIFSVPKHLTYGSLALGATPWQTLVGVVLPTASPGIFSALMMGLGRAVGETMIVLMATGNTPIMDANIFQGMRTLSANIAVEIPEAEVGSTHYRILFLAAFVLFIFTFIVNTMAELIRQRLRRKYGSL